MNLLAARVNGQAASLGSLSIPLTGQQIAALTGPAAIIGVRPEDWQVDSAGLTCAIETVEYLGADSYLHCRIAELDENPIVVRVDGATFADVGQSISLRPRQERMHIFDAATALRI